MTKPIGDNIFYVAFHTFGLFLYHSFMDRTGYPLGLETRSPMV